jgi:septal ring factor EnvC (AmiA/AmiB activator)
MYRNRKMQRRMTFVFSAKNINQMYRRTRFMNEYATYQKAQGEAVKQKQAQVDEKLKALTALKQEKNTLLARGRQEQQSMEKKQAQQQEVARQLQQQQKTVQSLIVQQQKQEADLNARIDKLIAEEIAREQARIEAEKKRKAEQAKKERERQQRLAEAKAREEKAKAEAKAAKTAEQKAAAKQRVKTAENERKTAEREVAESAKRKETFTDADPDKKLSGNFASNKGKLPMPITGNYQIVHGFGSNVVEGAGSTVRLSSKGLYLKGQPGAQARCVFDGVVSGVYANGNTYIVMVRHGRYISIYSDLASVSVSAGQKVNTNQTLGKLGASLLMQFQLRNWTDLLNPRPWLRR